MGRASKTKVQTREQTVAAVLRLGFGFELNRCRKQVVSRKNDIIWVTLDTNKRIRKNASQDIMEVFHFEVVYSRSFPLPRRCVPSSIFSIV